MKKISMNRIGSEHFPRNSPNSNEKMKEKKKCSSMIFSLTIHSLGIIFGDIGTSPLYVLETIFPNKSSPPTTSQCIGAISLIIWSLILVVSIKYAIFILQAQNKGEGGTFALCALLTNKSVHLHRRTKYLINLISILAASLLIGDGALTPAVSVLSAVEGLALNAPNLHRWIVPITVLIIISLFLSQQFGTSKIGNTFAPLMLLWFVSLFSIGIWRIRLNPMILRSFNPLEAIRFLIREKRNGFYQIGGVFLSVTGCEALYADLGHFGLWPIRLSWFCVVFPCVVTNYLGQGALLISNPKSIENPFYRSVPSWAHWPMLFLATSATSFSSISLKIIASQAIITGCFSLLSQASLLGFCPPLRVYHTSEKMIGQIYVPTINWILLILTLFVTIYFQRSSRLTNAYGLTVCSVGVITTILYLILCRFVWKKSFFFILFFCFFLVIDLLFWSANVFKLIEGAWIAILFALIFFFIGFSWFFGEEKLNEFLRCHYSRFRLNDLPRRFGLKNERQQSICYSTVNEQIDFENLFDEDEEEEEETDEESLKRSHFRIERNLRLNSISEMIEINENRLGIIPGIGCFLTENSSSSPIQFENYLHLLRNIPQVTIFLRILFLPIPFVEREKRLIIKSYGNIYHISARFGYAEQKSKSIDEDIFRLAKEFYHLPFLNEQNPMTFFLSNEIISIAKQKKKSFRRIFSQIFLSIYSIEKSLFPRQSINIQVDHQNTIQIGIFAEL